MGEVEASIFLGNSLIGGGGMGEKERAVPWEGRPGRAERVGGRAAACGSGIIGDEADDGLFEFAGELEGHFLGVVFGDGGAGVFAAVEGFVEGEAEGEGAVDAA